MTSEQQTDDPDVKNTQATVSSFLEHVQGAMQGVGNLRWEEVEFHLGSMEKIAETAAPSEKPLIDAFIEPTSGFALGLRQWATAKTAEDQEKALDLLVGARNALRKLRAEQPEVTNNPGFAQFALGIEGQILAVQGQIAKARGDPKEAARLARQQEHLVDEMIAACDPDDPMRHYFEGVKQFQEAVPKFLRGSQALQEMNLDLAQRYLEESTKSFSAMQEHLSKAKTDALILKAGKNAAEGCALLVSGQDAFVRTLRTAIIGDVNRNDVKALEKAERAFIDGADLMSKAAQAMPGGFGRVDFKAIARQTGLLTHNLRALCERSLSPKQITRATAPKVVFYFIGTFVVLLIALPISGLVTELKTSDIGLLLIVSLFVSVIGAFGFEATRLVPLFEVLARIFEAFARLLPWGSKSGERSKKAS